MAAEQQTLPEVPDLAARLRDGAPGDGGWAQIEPAGRRLGHPVGDVALCQMRDVVWVPATGMIYGADGGAVQSTLLAAGGRVLPMPKGRVLHLPRAALFQGFGGLRNYGHFLIDGVAGLVAMADLGLLARYPAATGLLSGWQRQVVALAGVPLVEVGAAQVRIDEVVFVTAMNHYLHRCDGLLPPLVARMGGQGVAGRDIVYLSRRGYTGRILLCEAELEAELATQGARVLQPERMVVAEQIAAMRGARVVVAPSGAALANVIFAPKGAAVIEIRPEPVREPWVDLICDKMGLRHVVVPSPLVTGLAVPLSARVRQAPRALARRYHYVTQVDARAVLAAVEEVLRDQPAQWAGPPHRPGFS